MDCLLLFHKFGVNENGEVMQRTIQISTTAHNDLYDITREVEAIVSDSRIKTGMVNVYAQGATAAIMILF